MRAFSALLTLSCASALPALPLRARGGALHARLSAAAAAADAAAGIVTNSTPNFFPQLIDHADPARGTFQQRFYVDESAWSGNLSADVFLYIGGEGPLGGTAGGMPGVLAKERGALQFALEHRYYGDSFPAPLSDRATLSTLRVDAALADLAAFIEAQVAARGLAGKWLVIGGSYPGGLSAWFRQRYPALAAASWSSSGVVNAVYNFTAFDAQVLRDVDAPCAAALHAVTAAFDAAWDDAAARAAMRALFATPDYFSKADMAWMLADGGSMLAQYGQKAALCAGVVDPAPGATPLEAFAALLKEHYGPAFGSSCCGSRRRATAARGRVGAGGGSLARALTPPHSPPPPPLPRRLRLLDDVPQLALDGIAVDRGRLPMVLPVLRRAGLLERRVRGLLPLVRRDARLLQRAVPGGLWRRPLHERQQRGLQRRAWRRDARLDAHHRAQRRRRPVAERRRGAHAQRRVPRAHRRVRRLRALRRPLRAARRRAPVDHDAARGRARLRRRVARVSGGRAARGARERAA